MSAAVRRRLAKLTRNAMRARVSGRIREALDLESARDAILRTLKDEAPTAAEDFVLSIETGEAADR
jgi:hypothetical protein